MKNVFRKALLGRTPTFGGWIQIGHPAIAEIFSQAGFDWVCVDLEHGIIDLETMAGIFRGLSGSNCVPVARLPLNDPVWIHRSLDAGARGLIIPMINSADEAERAIRCAKYPPRGERGYGFCRANQHGVGFDEYIRSANDEIAVIMQIEHKQAIENLEVILQVPGVDGAFIGPYDLSGSYGKAGQLDCDEMKQALAKYLNLCGQYQKAAGLHIVHPDSNNIQQSLKDGFSLIALGVDAVLLETATTQALQWAKGASR